VNLALLCSSIGTNYQEVHLVVLTVFVFVFPCANPNVDKQFSLLVL